MMTKRTRKSIALSLSLMPLVIPTAAALAQDVGDSSEPDSGKLNVIVVTAQKVKEDLQRTPLSITAITSAQIDQAGISDVGQIDQYTPNLLTSSGFSGGNSDANFFIRGIGQIDFVATSDPGVGLYIDGVYIGRTVGAALDTADVERIEVLRGPQGTLFGKNTIGGAINITTKQPTDELSGYVEATIGNYGRVDGKFAANVPLSDSLYARMSGVVRHNNGFAKRILDGVRLGDANDVGGRLALRWVASDNVEVQLAADVTKRRAHIAAHGNVATVNSYYGDLYTADTGIDVTDFGPSSDPRKINTTGVRPDDDLNIFGTSATIDWSLGGADFKSITAYRKMDQLSAADFDGTVLAYNDQEIFMDQKQFTQEFQLTGATSDDALNWILGFYYLHEDIFQDTVNPDRPAINAGFADGRRGATIDLETSNVAAYAQATLKVSEKLGITGGIRWTHEEKTANIFTELGYDPDLNVVPLSFSGKKSWSNVSPRFAIEYQANSDLLLYASATRGYKSGSFNGRPDHQDVFDPYNPENVWAFESGFKSELFENKLRLNAAAFLTQYKGIQLLTGRLDSAGNLFFPVDNAGDLDIRGFEAEIQARPTKKLNLRASVGYADEKWTNIYPAPFVTVSESTRLPSMSHWNLAVGGDYTVPIGNFGSMIFAGNWSYRSSYYHTTLNSPLIKEDGYGLLGASVAIEPKSQDWSLTFWGKNLTDASYVTWGQDLLLIGDSHATVWFGRPREYGATFRVNF